MLGADPLVKYQPAEDGKGGSCRRIGEEDLCIHHTSGYISSAREGVIRLQEMFSWRSTGLMR
ncbi:MAG: hypothetical protein ACLUAR_17895 [Pilosibacter sp.]